MNKKLVFIISITLLLHFCVFKMYVRYIEKEKEIAIAEHIYNKIPDSIQIRNAVYLCLQTNNFALARKFVLRAQFWDMEMYYSLGAEYEIISESNKIELHHYFNKEMQEVIVEDLEIMIPSIKRRATNFIHHLELISSEQSL